MKVGTIDHPKTKRLARLLETTRRDAVGLLEMLWAFVGRYAPQGDIGKYTDQEIAEAVDWEGDAHKLVESLCACGANGAQGYFDKHPKHRLIIHDWDDHAPDYVRKKLKRSGLRVAKVSRQRRTLSGQCPDSVATSLPSPSPPSPSLTSNPPTPRKRGGRAEQIGFDFDGGRFQNITDKHRLRWAEAYPAVDVSAAILRAAEWMAANPTKRKSNYQRFLTNWLKREQERGGSRPSARSPPQQGETAAEQLDRMQRQGKL